MGKINRSKVPDQLNHDFVVGINNIFDKEPPMVGSLSTNANTIAGFYDTLGRYLFAQAREKRLPWSLGFFSYYTATRSLYEDLRIRA